MKSPSNRPTFFVVSATTIIGALSSTIAGSAVAIVIGALAGLIWGLVVGRIVYWLGRHGGWGEMLAVRSVQLGVLIATTLFGGSLFAMMQYAFVLSTPEAVLALMRRPLGGGFTFFVVFNSLMEWLVFPAVLYLNWHHSARRIQLIVGSVLYYLSRAWTYLYFVPRVFAFMDVPAGPLNADVASRVVEWVNLSWIRAAIDGVVAILFVSASNRAGVTCERGIGA